MRIINAWFRRAEPMEVEANSDGNHPHKRMKKTRGSRAQALPVA